MSGERRPLIAGNWKMNKTAAEAREHVTHLVELIGRESVVADVAVCPPFTAIEATAAAAADSPIAVLAQAVHEAPSGAHTGEISVAMLAAAGATGTLVGHSERRAAGESDAQVAARVRAALDGGLSVVLCVGESLDQRESGATESWLAGQVRAALADVTSADTAHLSIAYEPIWAIGTGRTATPEIAQQACAHVRAVAAERVDGRRLRVLYGGSVTPSNAAELLAQPDIDGALVGGASLDAESFAAIVHAA
jgi:triosephosphate isomerase (TIM)